MAITANIQKEKIIIRNGKPFLSYRLTLIDDAQVVVDQVITEPFLKTETEEIRAGRYQKQFQELINYYKDAKTTWESQVIVLDNTATKIKKSLAV